MEQAPSSQGPAFFVIGHSHLGAVQSAHAAMPEGAAPGMKFVPLNLPEFSPALISDSDDPEQAIHPAILARLAAQKPDVLVSMLGGNDHAILSMLNHPRPFDFVLPDAPDLPLTPGAEILPFGLVFDALSRRIAPHLKLLGLLRQHTPGPFVHLESPPPIPSRRHIETHPGIFADRLAAQGLSPAPFRQKFWRLHGSLYRQECQRLGIHYLPVPPEMCDADGMLIAPAWNPDPTHGNALFGAAFIAKLLAWSTEAVPRA